MRYKHPPMPHKKCEGKNCYPRRIDAELVKDEQEIIHPELELNIYHCHLCGSWHLTRTLPKKQ